MYLDYYGFTEKPFTITPNPRFIFFSSIHKEAFALLLYGITTRLGFMELIGEVGTGKTTVLRTLLGQLDEETCHTALILNPPLSSVDLMRAVNQEFGIPSDPAHVAGLLGELNGFLLRENAAGRTVVLIIDEAQNLTPDVLEQIRLISNLETDTDKLIQIVLAGQPELARMLEKSELRQLNQRIALRYRIAPLGADETRAYIEHRLDTAGGGRKATFTAWAVRLIYRYSRGTPRLINMLCDRALLIGYTENSRKITGRIAALAWRDITLKPPRFSPVLLVSGALLASALVLALPYALRNRDGSSPLHRAAVPAETVTGGTFLNMTSSPGRVDPAAFKAGVLADLSVRSEEKSALQAFNAVTARWKTAPLTQLKRRRTILRELQKEAGARNLVLTPYSGSIDEVMRMGIPALFPLAVPGARAEYLVAVTGSRNGELQILPPLAGRSSFSPGEFLPLWSGRAFLVWRNYDSIPPTTARGARGEGVKKLQGLLGKCGSPGLERDGIYEIATVDAVRAFQSSRQIRVTGSLDPPTLMLLYRDAHYPGMIESPGNKERP